MQIAAGSLGADDGHKITIAFDECNLVNAYDCARFEDIPIDARGDPAIQDAEECVRGDILLGFDITQGAIDQLDDQMALVGLGMQGVRVISVKLLGSGGMAVAEETAKALGADTQI